MQAPGDFTRFGSLSGLAADAEIRYHGDDHEEAEKEQLDHKTTNDNPLAGYGSVLLLLREDTSACDER